MRMSFRVARTFGIDIKVHATFAIVIALGALQGGTLGGPLGALAGIGLVLALFACVTLHELGHALAAKRYGIPTREIVLWPLGGMALLSRAPSRPSHELVVALAGPAVNVVIAVVIAAAGLVTGLLPLDPAALLDMSAAPSGLAGFVIWLIGANVALVVFNMLPALPMDGGRVLRAGLAMALGHERATVIAARIGQVVAAGMTGFGLWQGHILLALIGVFVFFGATHELATRRARRVLSAWRLADVVHRGAPTVAPAELLGDVARLMLATRLRHVSVVHGGRFQGAVSRSDVESHLASHPGDHYVTEVMRRDVYALPADLPLDEACERMAERNEPLCAVVRDGRCLGLVGLDDVRDVIDLTRIVPPRSPHGRDEEAA